jgi:nucleotide-binding universal stress UspA family protein
MPKQILAAVDGSKSSRKALDFACELAVKFDARLHLLHVAQALHQDKTLVLGGAAITVHASPDELERAGRKVIEAARDVAETAGCHKVSTQTLAGDPAKQIIRAASEQESDMIVLGSRGLGDLAGLMLGSVSHKVAQMAPCTCITVR